MAPSSTLLCPACRDRLTFDELLAHVRSSDPERSLLEFECPLCHGTGHVRLRDGLAETVVPGRTVRVVSHAVLPELAVLPQPPTVLELWWAGTHRRVCAPRPLEAVRGATRHHRPR